MGVQILRIKFRCHRLPKVDEELHARTIFEPVAVEARPAKTKSKTRSKLKWKEDVDLKEKTEESKDFKTEESKDSTTNSEKAIRLNIKHMEESDQVKANENLEKSKDSTGELRQSILWMIIRKVLEEILIWLIIIIILIIKRIQHSLNF
ncbi:unnamed protein product [Cercopithifilaria johnstoni]|uniref:Uncharacterized protein n=1 Tax=Cercopithifilaria johnstoni TaxID=2874296 RepID=A0A8J2MN61_9BILA|nr:unnamed protein product [Cercopithifilaria johnstoni]